MSQHMEALDRANVVRIRQAEVKRALFDGEMTLREALDEKAMTNLSVAKVLAAQRRWGDARVAKALEHTPISETRRCGTLTAREKDLLAARANGYNRGWRLG